MEGFRSSGNYSKASKIKVPPGMKMRQLVTGTDLPESFPILRYFCPKSPIDGKLASAGDPSRSGGFGSRVIRSPSVLLPLSPVENLIELSPPPGVYRTPVKAVEGEEVLVMDGVPLSGGRGSGGRSLRSVSDSSSSSASSVKNYKSEIFHSWQDSGNPPCSSNCQVAHLKENLRPSRWSTKNRTEAQVRGPNYSSGQCSYSPTSHFPPQVVTPTRTASSTTSRSKLSSAIAPRDWCPQDDGIEVTLPHSSSTEKSPSRERVNAYINGILSGRATKRLSVFSEICSD